MADFKLNPANVAAANCADASPTGQLSYRYDYVVKNLQNSNFYDQTCTPWLYGNVLFENVQVNGSVTAAEVTAGGVTLTSRKPFDIPHPTKDGWRLRHVCIEGPESGVYFRGRLTGKNVIELPEYWIGLVDLETITVSLTQIGFEQNLIFEKVEWGKRIKIKSGNGSSIDCFYHIYGERKDGEKLIVEYEGKTVADYPGNNDQYSIPGFHYDMRA